MPKKTVEERLWAKVNKHGPDGYHYLTGENLGPCWLWTASKRKGYGRFGLGGKMVSAHVLVYEMEVGPIPDGLVSDHLCRVRACTRPSHLEPVTCAENVRRGVAGQVNRDRQLAKTHCPRGHEYSLENTRHYGGRRNCRACVAGHNQRYRDRKKAAA